MIHGQSYQETDRGGMLRVFFIDFHYIVQCYQPPNTNGKWETFQLPETVTKAYLGTEWFGSQPPAFLPGMGNLERNLRSLCFKSKGGVEI